MSHPDDPRIMAISNLIQSFNFRGMGIQDLNYLKSIARFLARETESEILRRERSFTGILADPDSQ